MIHRTSIQHITSWINNNLPNNIKIEDVAKQSGYSMWHLQRVFKEATGQPLGTYLREARLVYAANLLASSNQSISALCETLGFRSRPAFTRAFTAYFGMAPGLYRKQRHQAPTDNSRITIGTKAR